MQHIYPVNSLPVFDKKDIITKNFIKEYVTHILENIFKKINHSIYFIEIEAPALCPKDWISSNYTHQDMFVQQRLNNEMELVLKPETTPTSFYYAQHCMKHNLIKFPCVVWQASKSFRREQDQPTKHVRLKEFTHLEYQLIYSEDTKADYQNLLMDDLKEEMFQLLSLPIRVVPSDRLPHYSLKTLDLEAWNSDKWMEICSISVRKDFPEKFKIQKNNVIIEKNLLVCEVAFSLERLLYNFYQKSWLKPIFENLKKEE